MREQLARSPLARAPSTGSTPLSGTRSIVAPALTPLRPLFQAQARMLGILRVQHPELFPPLTQTMTLN